MSSLICKVFPARTYTTVRIFYEFYAEKIHISSNNKIVPQVEGQLQVVDNYRIIFDIPWGHQKVIISKAQNIEEALFYAHQTLSNSWSRSVLENQLKQQFYEHYRQGQTNFSQTLPAPNQQIWRRK